MTKKMVENPQQSRTSHNEKGLSRKVVLARIGVASLIVSPATLHSFGILPWLEWAHGEVQKA